MRRSIKEECNRDFERLGDPLQPPSANPIDTLLVLLDLLKRHSDPIREVSLRETSIPGALSAHVVQLPHRGYRLVWHGYVCQMS